MSLETTVHVGPYLACKVEVIESIRAMIGCPKDDCRSYDRSGPDPCVEWCPKHGTQLGPVERVVFEDKVNCGEMVQEIDEALHAVDIPYDSDGDSVYWLPNADRDPPREFTIEGDIALPLSSGDRSREILWFATAFEREIARLAAAYGDENVRTRWGVVAYTN